MKKALMFCVALVILSSAAYAQPYPMGYIGLFLDEGRTNWCVTGEGMYSFEMWILCHPSERGMMCAEFMISYPGDIIPSTVTPNDAIISVALGDLASGMSVCYKACQTTWHWNYHQTLFMTTPNKVILEVVPHPDAGAFQFANCLEGYPIEPCKRLVAIHVNYTSEEQECNEFAVKETNWGAIKGLYR